MSRSRRKKKIRITIDARDPRDAKRILDALKDAAQQPNTEPTPVPRPEYEVRPVPDEQLETKVNQAAAANLDEIASKFAETNQAAGLPHDAQKRESAEVVVEKRGRVHGFCRAVFDLGYRWSVDVVASTLEKMSKGGP